MESSLYSLSMKGDEWCAVFHQHGVRFTANELREIATWLDSTTEKIQEQNRLHRIEEMRHKAFMEI